MCDPHIYNLKLASIPPLVGYLVKLQGKLKFSMLPSNVARKTETLRKCVKERLLCTLVQEAGHHSFASDNARHIWVKSTKRNGSLEKLREEKMKVIFYCGCVCVCAQSLTHVWPLATPWTVVARILHPWNFLRITEWVAISFYRGSFQPRDQTHISCVGKQILYHCDEFPRLGGPICY